MALVALTGLVAEYTLIAVARSGFPLSFAAAPRYVYVAAPFLLLAVASLVKDPRLLAPIIAGTLIANVILLPAGAAQFAS